MHDFLNLNGLDAVIISDIYNMRYLSGFSGGEGYVYVSHSNKVIITDSRYTEAAAKEAKSGFEVIQSTFNHNAFDILKALAESDNAVRIGFEDLVLTCNLYGKLVNKCGFNTMIPLGEKVNDLRIIKSEDEIDLMRKAQSIADSAFTEILNYIRPGVSENMIAAELEYIMRRKGAQGLSFSTIVASGANSSLPHAVPTDRIIGEGDFITMDFGCIYDGYCSDMTRTIVVGTASDKQLEIYNTVLNAQLEAMKFIKSGVIGCEIHKIAADVIEKAGYGEYFGHGLGHSLGLYIHENPRFSPSEKSRLCQEQLKQLNREYIFRDLAEYVLKI